MDGQEDDCLLPGGASGDLTQDLHAGRVAIACGWRRCIAPVLSGLVLYIVCCLAAPVLDTPSNRLPELPAIQKFAADAWDPGHGWKPGPRLWVPSVNGWSERIKTYFHGGHLCPDDMPPCTLRTDMLELMNKYTVAGFDWSHGIGHHINETDAPSILGRGTEILRDAINQLKQYFQEQGNVDTMTFTYRQMQLALRYFSAERSVADAMPIDDDYFWIYNAGNLTDPHGDGRFYQFGGAGNPQPWGTSDPAWNFSSLYVQNIYVEHIIANLAEDDTFTGGRTAVFFDEVDQGGCCLAPFPEEYLQGVYRMLRRVVKTLNDRGIIPILSTFNRFPYIGQDSLCNRPYLEMIHSLRGLQWVRFYENWPYSPWESAEGGVTPTVFAASVYTAIEEAKLGIPNILHTGWLYPNPKGWDGPKCPPNRSVQDIERPGRLGGDLEWLIAAYLVVQSPGTLLSFSTMWNMTDLCYQPEFEVEFGIPLGPPEIDQTGWMWTREYSKARAVLDFRNKPADTAYYVLNSSCGLLDGCGHVYLK